MRSARSNLKGMKQPFVIYYGGSKVNQKAGKLRNKIDRPKWEAIPGMPNSPL